MFIFLETIYDKYFAKDCILRHYTQHLFLATIGFFILYFTDIISFSFRNIFIFVLFTFLPDIDGLLYVLIRRKENKYAEKIFSSLKDFDFDDAMVLATKHHKKFNKLLIHNIFGALIVISISIYFILIKNELGITISIAIMIHFLFDLFDDMWQLGHIKNWLWPLHSLTK